MYYLHCCFFFNSFIVIAKLPKMYKSITEYVLNWATLMFSQLGISFETGCKMVWNWSILMINFTYLYIWSVFFKYCVHIYVKAVIVLDFEIKKLSYISIFYYKMIINWLIIICVHYCCFTFLYIIGLCHIFSCHTYFFHQVLFYYNCLLYTFLDLPCL